MRPSTKCQIVDLAVSSSVVETGEGRCTYMWTVLHGLNHSSPGSTVTSVLTLKRFIRICEGLNNNKKFDTSLHSRVIFPSDFDDFFHLRFG